MDTPKCESIFSTIEGEILVVDNKMPRNEAILHCQEHSGLLAPLKTRKIFDEVRSKLMPCVDESGDLQKRDHYAVGLSAVNENGTWKRTWSDGTEYNASLHDSVVQEDYEFSSGYDFSEFDWEENCPDFHNETLNFDRLQAYLGTKDTLIHCKYSEPLGMPFLCMLPIVQISRLKGSGPSIISTIMTVVGTALMIPLIVELWIWFMKKRIAKKKRKDCDDENDDDDGGE